MQGRVQQRKVCMKCKSRHNDGPSVALLAFFFVLPAAFVLIVAWQTGCLGSLDTNQHF